MNMERKKMNNEVKINSKGIFIPLDSEVIEDLGRTANLRGMEISDFISALVTEAIDEERENHPQVFERDVEVDDTHLIYADGAGTVNEEEIL